MALSRVLTAVDGCIKIGPEASLALFVPEGDAVVRM
jgi:hypothetical protein